MKSHPLLAVLLVALLIVGCANPLLQSGETLEAIGQQFLQTGQLYDGLLDQGLITKDQYKPWATFATHFKFAYPQAVATWRAAKAANDRESVDKAAEVILALKNQLTILIIAALQYANK